MERCFTHIACVGKILDGSLTRSITRRKAASTEDDHSELSQTKQRPEGEGLLHIKTPKRELRCLFKQ